MVKKTTDALFENSFDLFSHSMKKATYYTMNSISSGNDFLFYCIEPRFPRFCSLQPIGSYYIRL